MLDRVLHADIASPSIVRRYSVMPEIYTAVQVTKLGIQVVKFGAGFISKVRLNDDLSRMEAKIQKIQSEAVSLGDKVANAHFHSALCSLNNIRMGNDAQTELRAAIHHLYDAYNVEHDLLDKELNFDQYLFCNKTAALISALHLYLSEYEIAEQWKEKASEAYNGAQAIYDNSIKFQNQMRTLLNMIDVKGYIDRVASAIRHTALSRLRIITEGQYIAFGSRYTFMKDLQVGIGPFKKSLLKAYFLSSTGHDKVCSKLKEAKCLINNINTMIEVPEKIVHKYDELVDSWDEILANIKNGTYKDKYKIGDKKTCDFASEGSIIMQIAAFDRDERVDGNGKAAITWVGLQTLNTPQPMGSMITSWEESSLRKYLNNNAFELLPLCLKNNIVSVWKDDGLYATYEKPTEDKIWIPGFREVFGKNRYEIFNTDYDCYFWWLRTPQIVHWAEGVGYFYCYQGASFDQGRSFDEQLRCWANAEDSCPCYSSKDVLPCFCV